MEENLLTSKKAELREQALRNRAVLGLDPAGMHDVCKNFFERIPVPPNSILAGYWPKDRELDVRMLLDEALDGGVTVALPVVKKNARLLKFVPWDHQTELVIGAYGIQHPKITESTKYLDPDIFLVPMLAFDRSGGRLGFGGGYYDTTLAHYRARKKILAVGLAYAQQACLFNLPREEHDEPMDWVITEQQAHCFMK